jgi:hypothetical protein
MHMRFASGWRIEDVPGAASWTLLEADVLALVEKMIGPGKK